MDPENIHRHRRPVPDYVNTWHARLDSAQERHLAQAFLAHLGRPLVESMGYAYDELLTIVSNKPSERVPIAPWHILMTPPEQRSLLQNMRVDLAYLWQKEGMIQTLYYVARRPWREPVLIMREIRSVLWSRMRERSLVRPLRRLVRHLRKGTSQCLSPHVRAGGSTDYQTIKPTEISHELLCGWQDPLVADRQMAAYRTLLQDMYQGKVRRDFTVAAECLRLIGLDNPSLLEIGCGNGHYSEVLAYLYKRPFTYIGLEYSQAMITSARENYPETTFVVGDALKVPFTDDSFDIAWSGTILMHPPEYTKAISETSRVAHRFCVFHSVPVRLTGPTRFLAKKAYGVPVAEVIISRVEFEELLHAHGLKIRHILESLPYRVDNVIGNSVYTLTYVCEVAEC